MALIIGGEKVPCRWPVFDWTEHGMKFEPGDGARQRKLPIDLFVWHWTGGEGNATQLYNVLDRKDFGVEFYVDQGGGIFQFADPVFVDTFDAGFVNPRSVGCEIASVGHGPINPRWPRERYTMKLNGRKVAPARFYDAQIQAALALADAVSDAIPTLPKKVPKGLFGFGGLVTRTLTPRELRTVKGHIGHFHVNAEKTDPGADLLEALIAHGY